MAKQPRGLAKMDAAIRAAGAVFARDGYRPATMDAVLLESGLSQGSLYSHFRGKDELARAVVARQREILGAHVESLSGAGVAGLAATFGAIARDIASNPLVRGGMRVSSEVPDLSPAPDGDLWAGAIERTLIEGRVAGTVRDDVDPLLTARIMSDSLRGIVAMSLATTDGADLESIVSGYIAACLGRLG